MASGLITSACSPVLGDSTTSSTGEKGPLSTEIHNKAKDLIYTNRLATLK